MPSTGPAIAHNIEQALIAAGKNIDRLRPRTWRWSRTSTRWAGFATSQLVDLIEIAPEDQVLDAGSGIGGTARFVADHCGCRVTAVDLTEEYCATPVAQSNRRVGRSDFRSPS